jgi:hypothetical protein
MPRYKVKLARPGEDITKEGWEKNQEPLSPIPKQAKSIIDETKLREVCIDLPDRTHRIIVSVKRVLAALVLILAVVFLVYVALTDLKEILLSLIVAIPVAAILYFVLVGVFNFLFVKERIISEIPRGLYEAGYVKIVNYEEYKEESTESREARP